MYADDTTLYCDLNPSIPHYVKTINDTNNDNDNELFIQTKLNEKHHKGNINNTYRNTNITTFVPRRLH